MYVMAAPLLCALLVNLLGRRSDRFIAPLTLGSLGFSSLTATLVLSNVLTHGRQSYTVGNWTPPYGIELIIDPLSALMLLLISGVALLATCAALPMVRREQAGKEYLFFTLYLILVAGLMGLVMTGDAFNLYVLLEITSITTYGLIAMGKGRAVLSSFNYIIMGSIGACFYLLGIGYLYILTGTLNMADIAARLPLVQGEAAVATAFAFLIVGLAIKMAFFPLHGWLPNAYSDAPMGASIMIAPLMTKVTVYLMFRVIFSIFAPDYAFYQHLGVENLVVWAASISIVAASLLALAQRNLRRMLTYIVIAEVGYMVGGIWLANTAGLTGALLHIVNDALMTLALFLTAATIFYRIGSLEFDQLKGLYQRLPLTMAAFTLGAFSMIGVPPTAGFFSKWYLILGGLEAGHWEYVVALIFSSLINAILFFRLIEIAYFSNGEHGHEHQAPLAVAVMPAPWYMQGAMLVTAASLIIVGLSSGYLVQGIIKLALPAGF
jgi:multicomponent Na+:H+ antiporter subunit D